MKQIRLYYHGKTLPKKEYVVDEDKVEELMTTGQYDLIENAIRDGKFVSKDKHKEEYKQLLIDLKGIGEKTAEKIIKKYPTGQDLYDANHKELYKYLDDNDVELLIKERFVKENKEVYD